jgi:hypothetical protein
MFYIIKSLLLLIHRLPLPLIPIYFAHYIILRGFFILSFLLSPCLSCPSCYSTAASFIIRFFCIITVSIPFFVIIISCFAASSFYYFNKKNKKNKDSLLCLLLRLCFCRRLLLLLRLCFCLLLRRLLRRRLLPQEEEQKRLLPK